MKPDEIRWIAIDWGTTNLRAWAMSDLGEVLDGAQSGSGMSVITGEKGDFESALLELINPWLRPDKCLPVFACGMVGARQGWREVPYESVPCSPSTSPTKIPTRSDQIEVSVFAGVSQDRPADVMRGEETQVAGLLAMDPDFEGLACLPGTHTKWVKITGGSIESFRTFPTGEFYALLSEHSVLRFTLSSHGWEEDAFLDSLKTAYENPELVSAQCFELRAKALLHDLESCEAGSRLSGILIGQEIAGALSQFPGTESVALVGSSSNLKMYELALNTAGFSPRILDAEIATQAGLSLGRANSR